jgi:orotidine-5'-phosphate decarboxylase
VAYKPNAAFYEAAGIVGESTLQRTAEYLKEYYPDHFLILDAKRGDIGNTARMYARSAFDILGCDAVTVAPYMGSDSVLPFLEHEGHFVVLLALTSNGGSADFQMSRDEKGKRLFERVIEKSREWGNADNMMYVVGATRGSLIGDVRKLVPDNFLLVPGVGAQGGSLEDVCQYGLTKDCGLLVNSSRGIIFADSSEHYAEGAAAAAHALQEQMAAQLDKLKH